MLLPLGGSLLPEVLADPQAWGCSLRAGNSATCAYSIFEEIWTRFSSFVLQVDPLEQGLVELGVVIASPGEERLVKVALTGGDAIDAGDFHAYEL